MRVREILRRQSLVHIAFRIGIFFKGLDGALEIFGGLLLCAGVLLFVAAHWDEMSPAGRFALVLVMVGAFHAAAAFLRERADVLAQALHGVGTVALGAGIFLAGQIFNLQEHWPGGFMLWAAGAWIAWLLLRDRIQAVLAAVRAHPRFPDLGPRD